MIVAWEIIVPTGGSSFGSTGLIFTPIMILFDEFNDLGEAIEELQKSRIQSKGWTIKKDRSGYKRSEYPRETSSKKLKYKDWVFFYSGVDS